MSGGCLKGVVSGSRVVNPVLSGVVEVPTAAGCTRWGVRSGPGAGASVVSVTFLFAEDTDGVIDDEVSVTFAMASSCGAGSEGLAFDMLEDRVGVEVNLGLRAAGSREEFASPNSGGAGLESRTEDNSINQSSQSKHIYSFMLNQVGECVVVLTLWECSSCPRRPSRRERTAGLRAFPRAR